MPRRQSRPSMIRPALIGLAGAIAAAITLIAGELRPARSLGPLAGEPILSVAPSRADLDYAHKVFERFRDRPADERERAVAQWRQPVAH